MECTTGKRVFLSRPEATKAMKHLGKVKRNRGNNRGQIEPYRCPFCRGWHLGHNKH